MKLPLFILIICLFFLVFTACTSEPGPALDPTEIQSNSTAVNSKPERTLTPTSANSTKSTSTTSPLGAHFEDLDGVEIQFWHPWIQGTDRAIQALVERFNAENKYGVVVTAISHSGGLYQDVWLGLNSGSFPVVVAAPNYFLQSWDNVGNFIVDLGDYLDDPEFGLAGSEISDFFPFIWEQDVFQGERLGLPAFRSSNLIFYNQSWAKDLGFDTPPDTPKDFKQQACAAAAASTASLDNPGVGGWIASMDPSVLMSWIMAFGGDGINTAGDGYHFTSNQVEAAFDFYYSLFNSGCAWIPENHSPNDAFAARQGLFYSSSLVGLEAQAEVFEDGEYQDEWTTIPYPSQDGVPVINLYGPSYAILNSAPSGQLAGWVFISWLVRPENQAVLVEAGGYFPASRSVIHELDDYSLTHPQWLAAQDLIPYSRSEPVFGSWSVARWALSEAAAAITNPDFSTQEIPNLLGELDTLLAEIHVQKR